MTQIKQLLNKNIDSFVIDIERELLLSIMRNMTEIHSATKNAQRLAREFLKLYPYSDKEIVLSVLEDIGKRYPEAYDVYIKFANEYYQQTIYHSTRKIHSHLQKGEIKRAIQTAKGGNEYVARK